MSRVYYLPNWDGTHEALVSAPTQKAACEALRTSVHGFRQYGGRRVDADSELGLVALSRPGRVWIRLIEVSVQGGRANRWHLHGARVESPP